MLTIEGFTGLVASANKKLLDRVPITIIYKDTTDLSINAEENENIINVEVGKGANIYAIWSRDQDSEQWRVMYIGQRTKQFIVERINQHLFKTPKGTQSKLEEVKKLVQSGKQIGLSVILVTPDTIRLSVEDQLIFNNTDSEDNLPWNNKSRNIAL